jgi:glycosyltransferase involved in cell wall biosynthesis
MRRLRILTWHIHGSYLYYLGHAPHDFLVPVRPGRPPGYSGLPSGPFPWPRNLREVPAEAVPRLQLDCVLYQSRAHYEQDRFQLLTPEQRNLPAIFLEHDPPREHPTDTRHVVDDPGILLVHVTPFNSLMWDSGRTPTQVIEHGVLVSRGARYTGELPCAIAVVNHIAQRGRRLGADILEAARLEVPIELVGMGSQAVGGLGEVPHDRLAAFQARYRVFFNPIRYTSLGLAVCEAMMIGMPIVALATTEMTTTVISDVTGYVDTRVERLIGYLQLLIEDTERARWLGENGRKRALERFSIGRFVQDWNRAFSLVTGAPIQPPRTLLVRRTVSLA